MGTRRQFSRDLDFEFFATLVVQSVSQVPTAGGLVRPEGRIVGGRVGHKGPVSENGEHRRSRRSSPRCGHALLKARSGTRLYLPAVVSQTLSVALRGQALGGAAPAAQQEITLLTLVPNPTKHAFHPPSPSPRSQV